MSCPHCRYEDVLSSWKKGNGNCGEEYINKLIFNNLII
jgi:hypothetical protein